MNVLKERFYLAKGGKDDVYVEKCPSLQHQIDGIRLLYKIFIKKKPGLILNDPKNYGKRIQTVLFINAVRHMLDKPVLILCADGRETKWLEHFKEWTNLEQEVVIETMNPFKRVSIGEEMKKAFVYVNPLQNINLFSKREWSILIIDNDVVTRDIIQAKLSANFKIWVNSMDVKKKLKTLFLPFYKWLYPKETIDFDQFIVKTNNSREVLEKGIKLDAFTEDIVLRRNVLVNNNVNKNKENNDTIMTQPKVTRKNKDATGKKIKRSKRKNDEIPEPEVPTKVNKSNISNNNITSVNDNFNFDNIANFECIKRSNKLKPDQSVNHKFKTKSFDKTETKIPQNNDVTMKDNLNEITKTCNEVMKEENIVNDHFNDRKTNDLIINEDSNDSVNILEYNTTVKTNEITKICNVKEENVVNDHFNEINKTNELIINEDSNDSVNILECTTAVKTNEITKTCNEVVKEEKVVNDHFNDNNKTNELIINEDSNDSVNILESNAIQEFNTKGINIANNEILKDDNDININNSHKTNDIISENSNDSLNILASKNDGGFVKLISIDDNEITKEISNELPSAVPITNRIESENLFSIDEFNSVLKKVANEKTNELDIVNKKADKGNSSMSEIDLKLKEMEELTLKKFKGSFLDSIF